MKTIDEIRRENLLILLGESGSLTALSRKIDKSPAQISQWKNASKDSKTGKPRGMHDDTARLLEDKCGKQKGWMDVSHDEALDLGPSIKTPLRPVRAIDNPDEAEHELLHVPRYTLKASAGTGEPVLDIDLHGEPNYMRRSWAKRRGLDPDNLFSIVAVGNSMEPEIHDSDSLIVHRQSNIESDKLMVICFRGECYVKRVLRQFDGSLIIKSTNPDYHDVVINLDQAEELHVVGRVVSITHNA